MNTGFSYRERNAGTGRRRLLLVTIFVIVLFLVDMVTGGSIRAIVRDANARISLAARAIGMTIASNGYFTSHAALASQNVALQARVATLEEQIVLSASLQQQVTTLSEMAHLATTEQGITVPVASSFIASPYGTFLVGAGIDEGVSLDSLVLSGNGTAIGTISYVSAHTATVTEVFAPGVVINALLDGAPVSVHGAGGGNATTQVPHGVSIAPGDVVTAPSLGGHTIGIVGHVDTDPSSAAMQVYIGSPVNSASLQYVFVVSPRT